MPLAHRHGAIASTGEHPIGHVLDGGWRYDAQVWMFDTFVLRGRLGELRQAVLDVARLEPGDALLDVGSGTGTLAIAAAARVGPAGHVAGIEPAPRQLIRARWKARRAGRQIDFRAGAVQDIPFPDETFDAATGTLMLHHLPEDGRERGVDEMLRVLKRGGRLVLADFDHDQAFDHDQDRAAPRPCLPELLRRHGCADLATESIRFPRTHRGWSGATIASGVKR